MAAGAVLVEIDLRTAGNTPRSTGHLDDCASVSTGEEINIDVLLPGFGVAESDGLSAYQFSLDYPAELLSVTAERRGQLLEQAPGSNLITIADPLPDRNGVYVSWAVDFGPAGIEPDGSSETGPGVIGGLTLEAEASGSAKMYLFDVKLIDDASEEIPVETGKPVRLEIDGSCPGAVSPTPTPAPDPSQLPAPTPTPFQTSSAPPAGNEQDPADGMLPRSGGLPLEGAERDPLPLVVLGLVLIVLGGSLMYAGAAVSSRRGE